ncbi:hypothetical protein EDB85DRAFT_136727 [Lactarius pseudohatsudake]|nr:hypothetical protein EDB85DRAFT_136727 [Lactarius pseudohatsudake]
MVYDGTIRPGSCEGAPQLDIVSAFQSYGKYLQDGQNSGAERERFNTVPHACPDPGACGGVCFVYFYESHKLTQRKDVSSAAEALGMTPPCRARTGCTDTENGERGI